LQTPSFSSATTDLSLGQRLIRVLHDPKGTFESLGDEPGWQDWVVPALVVALLAAASTYVTLPLMDPVRPEVRDELARLSEQERAQAIEVVEMVRSHGWLTLPLVNSFSALVAVSVVLMGVARWVFRSEAGFRHMLVVTAYASVTQGVESVVRTPLMLLSGSLVVHLGPGALVSKEMAATYLGRLLLNISLAGLWQLWIIGIGFGVMAGIPPRRSLSAEVMLSALWLVFSSASLPAHVSSS